MRRSLRALWILSVYNLLITCHADELSAPVHKAPVSLLAGPNLLLDPGFEAGGTDWQNSAAAGRSVDATQVQSGSAAERIQASAAGESTVYQDVTVTAEETYDASGWIFAEELTDQGAVVEVLWLDSPGLPEVPPPADVLGTELVGGLNGSAGWTNVAGVFVAPAGAVIARVQLRVAVETDDVGAAWFDDLALAVELPPPVDVTPPEVAITAPVSGTTVSGTFTISADATDDGEVAGVQFRVDGINVGAEIAATPYNLALDSYTLANGSHVLSAVARDTAGNATTSADVSIEVDNHPPPRNVIVILSDDQRFDHMPYLPLTSSLLNAETVRFTRGFATTSLCCPSRSSILTGLYAHNHKVLTNAAPNGGVTKFKASSTIATWLHQAGYRTGLIGKYLNEYYKISPAIPPGWDDFQVFTAAKGPDYYNYSLNENGTVVTYGSATSAYSTDVLAHKAAQFIWATPTQQPLFLIFAAYAPHAPATPSATDAGIYAAVPKWRPPSYNEPDVTDKPAWVRALPKISAAAMAASDALHQKQLETLPSLDRAVASIIATLQLNGRWGSTLVIFMSDNSYSWGEHRIVDRKNCPYEECIRVPFWVRAPGLVARTDTNLVANIDLAPTIAAWAGITPPGKVNGMNLLPLLQSPGTAWRSALLIEHTGTGSSTNSSGVRTARYLYNEYQNGNKELYDLVTDPYQRTSSHKITANAALMASLKATLNTLKAQ